MAQTSRSLTPTKATRLPVDSQIRIPYHYRQLGYFSMRSVPHIHQQRPGRLFVLGLLLLVQLLGVAEPHSEHALAPLSVGGDHGAILLEGACHPRDAAHLEEAGRERLEHSCAACLHLLRTALAGDTAGPRLAPPDPAPLALAASLLSPSREHRSSAGPRAPPALA